MLTGNNLFTDFKITTIFELSFVTVDIIPLNDDSVNFGYSWSSDINSSFPSFSLPDALSNPTDLICWKRTPFEAMIGRTAPSSDGLLAEVSRAFSQP